MNCKTTQRRIPREGLSAHGFVKNHINNGIITRFQEFRAFFQLLPRTVVNLLLQLGLLASIVNCTTTQHRCMTSTIWPGWFRIILWAGKPAAFTDGSFLLLSATLPGQTSLTDKLLTLKPKSSGRASYKASWYILTDFISVLILTGSKVTTMLILRTPVSTGTVPIPPVCRWHGREDARACPLDVLVAGCNSELQAAFQWHWHLYGWLSVGKVEVPMAGILALP